MRASVCAAVSSLLVFAAAPAEARPYSAPPATHVFPVVGAQGFGESAARFGAGRGGRAHDGQDVFAQAGAPLVAVADGRVLETGSDGGRGNYLAIFDPVERRTYLYLHMRDPARVKPGSSVAIGARIGSVGCSGSCWGDHLHFEVRRGRGLTGPALDPLPLLRRWPAA